MTNPRDPEGLMPDAGVDGPPVNPDEPTGEPEARFPGAGDDVTMTTGDAGSGFGAGVVAADEATEDAGE